ncbi:MAG TPA: HAD family phosphatase [Acetobacteraceae bacterium]
MQTKHTGVVFDLGGVLIDWNPRHLYRKLFPGDEPGMEQFLTEVCSPAWNLEQDRGRTWAEATALLTASHPQHKPLIEAYRSRWHEMLGGPIEGTVAILRDLKNTAVPLFGLTNWSHETFPLALELYDFLGWFQAIIVSGQERLVKPDPRIYRLLTERYGLDLASLVYIDDNPGNAAAATRLGMHGVHFTDPATLRAELVGLNLLRS